jgi:hypothetical protein
MYQVRLEPVIRIAPSLISYMRSFDDVWFGTLSETYDCWTEDSAALVLQPYFVIYEPSPPVVAAAGAGLVGAPVA